MSALCGTRELYSKLPNRRQLANSLLGFAPLGIKLVHLVVKRH